MTYTGKFALDEMVEILGTEEVVGWVDSVTPDLEGNLGYIVWLGCESETKVYPYKGHHRFYPEWMLSKAK